MRNPPAPGSACLKSGNVPKNRKNRKVCAGVHRVGPGFPRSGRRGLALPQGPPIWVINMYFHAARSAPARIEHKLSYRIIANGGARTDNLAAAIHSTGSRKINSASGRLTPPTCVPTLPLLRTQAPLTPPGRQPPCLLSALPESRGTGRVFNVKQQDTDRCIPSGRNPGSGATW